MLWWCILAVTGSIVSAAGGGTDEGGGSPHTYYVTVPSTYFEESNTDVPVTVSSSRSSSKSNSKSSSSSSNSKSSNQARSALLRVQPNDAQVLDETISRLLSFPAMYRPSCFYNNYSNYKHCKQLTLLLSNIHLPELILKSDIQRLHELPENETISGDIILTL